MPEPNAAESLRHEMQQFLYAVSHDLQEPFRKVRTFGRRLAEKLEQHLDDSARADLERMLGAAERGQGMIEGLLVLSRIETQGGSMGDVDLNATLAEVCKDLRETVASSHAVISVEPLPTVHGDAGQMKLLFRCLVDNALKFHEPATPPTVRVLSEPFDRPDCCRIVVEDNGIGLDEQHADRVFTVFQRLHPRDVYPGLGLGLAYSRKIVEGHDGTIEIESPTGQGTRLVLTLPTKA
jgi:light-regulated signal transduction histidine kinase (bacteriophytochrome)